MVHLLREGHQRQNPDGIMTTKYRQEAGFRKVESPMELQMKIILQKVETGPSTISWSPLKHRNRYFKHSLKGIGKRERLQVWAQDSQCSIVEMCDTKEVTFLLFHFLHWKKRQDCIFHRRRIKQCFFLKDWVKSLSEKKCGYLLESRCSHYFWSLKCPVIRATPDISFWNMQTHVN